MNDTTDSTESFSDENVAALLQVALEKPDVLGDLEYLPEIPPRQLWQNILDRCDDMELRFSTADAAQLLDTNVTTFERWLRQKEVTQNARRRVAALYELITLFLGAQLNSVREQELRVLVSKLRSLPDEADDDTIKQVLSLVHSQFDQSPPPDH